MPDKGTQGPPPETYRSPLALMVWWVWLAFAVANLIDIAVQGRDRLSLEAAAALVLVTGIMYVGALRPRVIATARGIVVRNPLRDHRVPWTSVSGVDVRDLLRVHCAWPEPGPGAGPIKDKVRCRRRDRKPCSAPGPSRRGRSSPRAGEPGRRPGCGPPSAGTASRAAPAAGPLPRSRPAPSSQGDRADRAGARRARPPGTRRRRRPHTRDDAELPATHEAPVTGDAPVTGGALVTGGARPVSAWHWPAVLAIVVPALLLAAAILA